MITICREFLQGVHIGVAILIPACAAVWLLLMLGGAR